MEINFPYTGIQLTEQVNRVPNVYGLLNEMNLMPTEGSVSTIVEIKRENGTLVVLSAADRGSPPSLSESDTGDALYFEIPHFPLMDLISPTDIQNATTQVGRGVRPRTLDDEVSKKLITIRNKHAITREYVRMGALKGILRDGRGRVLHNLFQRFGVNEKVVNFALSNANTDVLAKCEEVRAHVQNNLLSDTMTNVEVLVDTTFFNALVSHPKVEKFFVNWQAATMMSNPALTSGGAQGITGRVFPLGNLVFREYSAMVPIKNAKGETSVQSLVDLNTGRAFPRGTMNTFATYDAPANDVRYVNTPGSEVYVSPEPLKHGKGVELLSESNPLAICKRPEALVKCTNT